MWLQAKIDAYTGEQRSEKCPHCGQVILLAEVFLDIRLLSFIPCPKERVFICSGCGGVSGYPSLLRRLIVASYLVILLLFIGVLFAGILGFLYKLIYTMLSNHSEFPWMLMGLGATGALISGGAIYWMLMRLKATWNTKDLAPYDWRFPKPL